MNWRMFLSGGHGLYVECIVCDWKADIDPAAIQVSGNPPYEAVKRRFTCHKCGGKGPRVTITSPWKTDT